MQATEARTAIVATIAQDASVSDHVNLEGQVLVGITMPDVWDAAVLTFQVSMDDVRFLDAYSSAGAEHTITVAADQHIWLDPSQFASYRWLIVRSGTTATPVDQTTGDAPRLIELVTRGIG